MFMPDGDASLVPGGEEDGDAVGGRACPVLKSCCITCF
jgi:hypothetical protein